MKWSSEDVTVLIEDSYQLASASSVYFQPLIFTSRFAWSV